MQYTVKEMANELQLTTHAIRYYTDQGLIPHVTRDKNNNRLFDDEAKLWLLNVKYMRNCGMSIHDIKRYVELNNEGVASIAERFRILLKQKEIIHMKMKELQESANYLDRKIEYYATTFLDIPAEEFVKKISLEELSAGL
ncbi:MerR family transcriptional regulator [Listeria sp. FSL L7-1485]|uniref:MerR family transcriptional regulator n=1 Tax=Listeria immobilis TaxID=2713502 RepID=A0A7X1C9W7_9LIST|nr:MULTISPECIES: MerR family transcriptional regulator [Listeria]MBC1483266.1 MerR family transcriptional regulator [Listeria immobilis]MBC1489738.1 MerR family transcriptional regulator [Listeria immobilis]MBC1505735.1 MerR family transcriptional regulator [Listeria immobilis]MBC1508474.1 MerR family transcriptional regulator [Listeria immobilis]MBC1514828.1 MerR family transcriptional regulator [Listeria immobilis]